MTTAETIRPPGGAFAALSSRSYRIYLLGQSLANTGTWMQSIAQDWLIFDLTHSSTAVGITMALQFLPMLLFGLQAGALADRVPKRRILLTTQTLNAAATATLAVITIAGVTKAADVYAFALVSGMIFAFDVPARQSFVTEVVPADRLRAAISLTAAIFQATRLIGPAIASLLIVSVGTGWVFAVNAACYLGPTIGLLMLRPADLRPAPAAARAHGTVREAVRYLRGRPEVLWTIFLVGMLGTFGLNFPIVLTAMAKSTFGGDASTYGLFNIVLGLGSAAGAVLAGAGAAPGPGPSWARRPCSASSRRPRRSRRASPSSWCCWPRWASSTWCARRWPTPRFSLPSTRSCAAGSWACTCWSSSAARPSAPPSSAR